MNVDKRTSRLGRARTPALQKDGNANRTSTTPDVSLQRPLPSSHPSRGGQRRSSLLGEVRFVFDIAIAVEENFGAAGTEPFSEGLVADTLTSKVEGVPTSWKGKTKKGVKIKE